MHMITMSTLIDLPQSLQTLWQEHVMIITKGEEKKSWQLMTIPFVNYIVDADIQAIAAYIIIYPSHQLKLVSSQDSMVNSISQLACMMV